MLGTEVEAHDITHNASVWKPLGGDERRRERGSPHLRPRSALVVERVRGEKAARRSVAARGIKRSPLPLPSADKSHLYLHEGRMKRIESSPPNTPCQNLPPPLCVCAANRSATSAGCIMGKWSRSETGEHPGQTLSSHPPAILSPVLRGKNGRRLPERAHGSVPFPDPDPWRGSRPQLETPTAAGGMVVS